MPWYKEAVINSHNLIDQLGLENDAEMKKEKTRLQIIIQDNDWNEDDLKYSENV